MTGILISILAIGAALLLALMVIGPALFGSPWHPISRRDLKRALDFCDAQAGERIIDLGSGDGRVLISAAKDYGLTGTGIEIDPIKVWLANWRVRIAGVADKVRIVRANIFDADLIEEKGTLALVRLGGIEVEIPRRGCTKGRVKVALRPHALTLSTSRPPGPAIAGRMLRSAYLGKNHEVTVDTAIGELFIVTGAYPPPPERNADVWIGVDIRGICLVPATSQAPGLADGGRK